MREARRRTSFAGARWYVVLCGGLLALACASSLTPIPGGYQHARHGYRIGTPNEPQLEEGAADSERRWEAVEVPGAVLAFSRPGPQMMTFQSRCNRPVAKAETMARQLLIGIDGSVVTEAGSVAVAGREGWIQRFEIRQGGDPVRVTTLTLIAGPCSYDWGVAISGPLDESVERDFERWWQSFEFLAGFPRGQPRGEPRSQGAAAVRPR